MLTNQLKSKEEGLTLTAKSFRQDWATLLKYMLSSFMRQCAVTSTAVNSPISLAQLAAYSQETTSGTRENIIISFGVQGSLSLTAFGHRTITEYRHFIPANEISTTHVAQGLSLFPNSSVWSIFELILQNLRGEPNEGDPLCTSLMAVSNRKFSATAHIGFPPDNERDLYVANTSRTCETPVTQDIDILRCYPIERE